MLLDEWFPDVSKDHSAFIFNGQAVFKTQRNTHQATQYKILEDLHLHVSIHLFKVLNIQKVNLQYWECS